MGGLPSIPERIQFLQQHVYPTQRGPWTDEELAGLLNDKDVDVTAEQLTEIIHGDAESVPFAIINGLSQVFGVSLDVFGNDPSIWEESASWISAMRSRLNSRSQLAAARNLRRAGNAHRNIRTQWNNR